MIREFHHHTVNIADKVFISNKGTRYNKTAILKFFDNKNKLIGTHEFGNIEVSELYHKIETEKKIIIDEGYVKNFSITAYRRLNLLNKKDIVELKEITANDSFFETHTSIDFSRVSIKDSKIDFSNSTFIGGELAFNNSDINNCEVDFSYIKHEAGDINFSNIHVNNGTFSFKNSILANGKKNFQYAHFNSTFVDFSNCEFNSGDINMVDSHFSGGLSFKIARIKQGRVAFQFAVFQGKEISFDRTEFGDGEIDFRTTEFKNAKVSFNRCVAEKGNVNFSGANIDGGKFTFKRANLGMGNLKFVECISNQNVLNFAKADLHDCSIDFENAKVYDVSFENCFFNKYLNFKFKEIRTLNLNKAVIRDIMDLTGVKNSKSAERLFFVDMNLPGLLNVDWYKNNILNAIFAQGDETSYSEKAEQFLMLKENFSRNGRYDEEDLAYVAYRRCKAKSRIHDKGKGNKLRNWTIYFLDKLLLDYSGLYATSPLRVFVTMIVFYILFSFSYLISILTKTGEIIVSVGQEYGLPLVSRCFYHSGITMLTIGYGDHFPIGIARGLSAIEGFVGMLLLSYFTVSLVHKILR